MRILLSSCIIFLMVGCGSYPKKNGFTLPAPKTIETLNPYFSDTSKDYVYKAKIRAFDKNFGGIFIVKKLGDIHHRIVFTTEMGNTIFDFDFREDAFKINRILPEMDKKLLLNVLKRDFLALVREKPTLTNSYSKRGQTLVEAQLLSKKHYYHLQEDVLRKIVKTARGKEKVTFLFSGINNNIAKAITIVHHGIKLEIALTRLK